VLGLASAGHVSSAAVVARMAAREMVLLHLSASVQDGDPRLVLHALMMTAADLDHDDGPAAAFHPPACRTPAPHTTYSNMQFLLPTLASCEQNVHTHPKSLQCITRVHYQMSNLIKSVSIVANSYS